MKSGNGQLRRTIPGSRRGRKRLPQSPLLRVSFKHALGFGPGKVQLLDAIEETGSIAAGARRIGMSYKRAWDLVSEMNTTFRHPLVVTEVDGRRFGGAALTDEGREALALFRQIRTAVEAAVAEEFAEFCSLLATADEGAPGNP